MTTKEEVMREAGYILNTIFSVVISHIKPGLELKTIDTIVNDLLRDNKAKSGLKLQGFPANIAISLNEEVIQGIPDNRVISEGDLISLDMTLYYKGFFVDKAVSLTVDPSHYVRRYLITAVKKCFDSALIHLDSQIKRLGRIPAWSIGKVIEQQAHVLGVATTAKLAGHGIGEGPHLPPVIPNVYNPKFDGILLPDMFITIEPIVFYGRTSKMKFDEFTVNSQHLSAHWEDTIALSKNGAEVIT